jgi:large subunit ribosomal protein L3
MNMIKAIIGKKLGMTSIYDENGKAIAVTAIEAGPCIITQIKTDKIDGYNAIQIGFGDVKAKKLNKPIKQHFKNKGIKPKKVLMEVRVDNTKDFKVGDIIKTSVFEKGDVVKVTARSKGKGFTGAMKRYGFSGQPASHGSQYHRALGSTGASSYPSRVFKGKKMPGRHGYKKVSTLGLEIFEVDEESNVILVKGSIPGTKGRIVLIQDMGKRRGK